MRWRCWRGVVRVVVHNGAAEGAHAAGYGRPAHNHDADEPDHPTLTVTTMDCPRCEGEGVLSCFHEDPVSEEQCPNRCEEGGFDCPDCDGDGWLTSIYTEERDRG